MGALDPKDSAEQMKRSNADLLERFSDNQVVQSMRRVKGKLNRQGLCEFSLRNLLICLLILQQVV